MGLVGDIQKCQWNGKGCQKGERSVKKEVMGNVWKGAIIWWKISIKKKKDKNDINDIVFCNFWKDLNTYFE